MSVVAKNLVHQQLWHDVSTFQRNGYSFCKGTPPKKLHPDDLEPVQEEIILETRTSAKWTVAQWVDIFEIVSPAQRIVMAMVTDDSTVVYYIIYKGLQVPRKN